LPSSVNGKNIQIFLPLNHEKNGKYLKKLVLVAFVARFLDEKNAALVNAGKMQEKQ